MKIFTDSIDWADEGDIFFFSIMNEEELQAMKELLKIFIKHDSLYDNIEMYWGTNECFNFDPAELVTFINKAKDISDEELRVFQKFEVRGFDIYERICKLIDETFSEWVLREFNDEIMNEIEPHCITLFGQDYWTEIQQTYDCVRKK